MRTASTFFFSILLALLVPCAGLAQDAGSPVAFQLRNVSLRASLDSLMKWYPVSIVYMDSDVEGHTVTASCSGCDIDEALNSVLSETRLTWLRSGSQVILRLRPATPSRAVATIAGIVRDSLTGEPAVDVNVLLMDSTGRGPTSTLRRWCPTNSFGFYSLRQVPPGMYQLVIRAVGYRPMVKTLEVTTAGSLQEDVTLTQESIAFQEVMVEGHRSAFSAATGLSRGVYIRSTPADQNQYLLDGARVYNPSHFGGVLSTFSTEALNDVQVVAGGLPPSYGGRIGGILDLSLRDGTMHQLSGSAGTGSLGSHLALEGPISGPATFLFSARRGYPNAAIANLRQHGTPSRLGSTELIGKVSYRLSGSERLSLSGYYGHDTYDNQVVGADRRLSNIFSWGNGAINLRWTGIASPSLFLQASAVYTRYDLTLDHWLQEAPPYGVRTLYASDYGVEDISVRAYAEHYYDEEHTVRGGVELVNRKMRGRIDAFSSLLAPLSLNARSSWEFSLFLQDQWRILPRVTAELGGRMTNFTGSSGTFSAVDPRFSLLLSVSEQTRWYAALTSVNQFVHPYRNSGVFLLYPAIFWYPSSEQVKPVTAMQMSLGVQKEWGKGVWGFSAEAFYRVTHNLHEFMGDTATVPTKSLDQAALAGTGKSYGVEVSIDKRVGDLTGSVSYTLSWDRNQFAELYGGASFSSPFDRRHEFRLSASYAPADRWLFTMLCVIATQELFPSQGRQMATASTSPFGRNETGAVSAALPDFSDINGGRFPGFQRLELGTAYRFPVGGVSSEISLRLMNGYGLIDPFAWQLGSSSAPQRAWFVQLRELELFPLYPTLGLTVRF